MSSTYPIPEVLLPKLAGDFAALAKRARKLRVEEPTYEVVGTRREGSDEEGYKTYALVQVHGAAPKLKGWSFLGTVTTSAAVRGYLVNLVPGTELDPVWREAIDPRSCDHCNTRRRRKDTFIVRSEAGELKLVGRSCLKDFLGHRSPERIVSYLTYLLDLMESFSSDGEGGYGYPLDELLFSLERFMLAVCISARLYGFMTKGEARDRDAVSTADDTWMTLTPNSAQERESAESFFAKREPADTKRAKEIVKWIPALWDGRATHELTDYVRNVQAAYATDLVAYKTSGLMASTYIAHARAVEAKAACIVDTSNSQHISKPKERLKGLDAVVLSSRWIESFYGDRQLVRMATTDGDVLIWWNTGKGIEAEAGNRFKLDGTVKSHETYRGTKQTTLNRCKIKG